MKSRTQLPAVALYRALLFLYPPTFRRRFMDDMVEMFADTYAERRKQGLVAILYLWSRTLRDLCVTVASAWLGLDPSPNPITPTVRPRRTTTGKSSMDSLTVDLRYTFRTLRRNPGFAFIATITLALGIGATSAVFSVLNGVLLRPLPYPEQDRLAVIWTQFPDQNNPEFPISPAEFLDYRAESRAFQEIGVFGLNTATVTGDGAAERVAAAGITHSLIPVLDIHAAVGRTFTAEEDRPGAPNVVLLSDRYWRRRFGGDRSVIGTSLVVDDASQTVIGVLPPNFHLPGVPQVDVFFPLGFDRASITNRSGHWLTAVGRLAPGATIESANREIDDMLIRWEDAYAGQHTPNPTIHPMFTLPLTEELFGDVRPLLIVLVLAVGLVLLLTCANVANLLLARGEARRRELSMRTALGASRGRVVRQLLTESTVLAIGAGMLGLVIGAVGTDLLLRMEPENLPRVGEIGLDWRVVLVTFLISVATGIIFGTAPALSALRTGATEGLTTSDRGGTTRRESRRLLRGLTVLQMALASVLLISSGLLVKSFAGLVERDPGFEAQQRLGFDVELTQTRYPDRDAVVAFYDRLLEELRAVPGVQSVAAARGLPMREAIGTEGMEIEGRPALRPEEQPFIDYQQVTPGYFATMAIPVVNGREFAESDRPTGMPVALLNETAAQAYFPNGDAVGERIRGLFAGPDAEWRTIVGVVGSVRHNGLGEDARPELYLPYAQTPPNWAVNVIRGSTIAVRGAIAEEALAPAARRIVQAIDPDVPISNMGALDDAIANSVSTERFATLLLGIFAGVALLIAAIGVYGVMAFTVARQSKEIGIRLALGAEPKRVMRSVISGGLTLAGIGAGLGIVVALAATRVLESQLYGVGARDPIVFASAIGVLGIVATMAVTIPAFRASGTDPTDSLRTD